MRSWLILVLPLLGFMSLLTGCVAPQVVAPQVVAPQIDSPPDNWHMQGRVGIRMPTETLSFSINWRQELENFDIRLSATLGIPVAHLVGGPGGVVLKMPGKAEVSAAGAAELLKQHTNLDFPVEYLRYWVRGKPAPNHAYQTQQDRLAQASWVIDYLDFDGPLPKRLRLNNGQIVINLVVSRWQR
ncbi:MAG: lipoprotein insertase outer membrane protein LolB [Pseudomonadales bacterium]|nr:lipoprotein insertase outer membrane protein LolB [Pseudomonadales bacterium]